MTVKKTVYLQEDVFAIAKKNAKVSHNGNLSNYINSLINNVNKDEIDKLAREREDEINKPKKCGKTFNATKVSTCEYCGKDIQIQEKICYAQFSDEHKSYVHIGCCKK